MEALILLGSGLTLPARCLAGVLQIFFFFFFTFWVTSLGLDRRSGKLRQSLFYLMFMGSFKGGLLRGQRIHYGNCALIR